MKLLDEIRQQPLHIRHLFMWTMVAITFSVIGFLWFQETKNNFVALLNPKQQQEQTAVASEPSPFSAIGRSLKSLQANISELFRGKPATQDATSQPSFSPVIPQRLP